MVGALVVVLLAGLVLPIAMLLAAVLFDLAVLAWFVGHRVHDAWWPNARHSFHRMAVPGWRHTTHR